MLSIAWGYNANVQLQRRSDRVLLGDRWSEAVHGVAELRIRRRCSVVSLKLSHRLPQVAPWSRLVVVDNRLYIDRELLHDWSLWRRNTCGMTYQPVLLRVRALRINTAANATPFTVCEHLHPQPPTLHILSTPSM